MTFTLITSALLSLGLILGSPDGRLSVELNSTSSSNICYTVAYDGNTVILPSKLGILTNNADYTVKLCSDDEKYGGQNLVEYMTYPAKEFDGKFYVELYLPARTAVVLKEGKIQQPRQKAEKPAAEEKPAKAAKAPAKKAPAKKAEAPAEKPKRTRKSPAKKAE